MSAAGKVCTGFSKPYVAKYSNDGGAVTYSGVMQLAPGWVFLSVPRVAAVKHWG